MSQATIQMPTHSHEAWRERDKGCKCQLCLIKFGMADFCYLCTLSSSTELHAQNLTEPSSQKTKQKQIGGKTKESLLSSLKIHLPFVYLPFASLFGQLTDFICKHNSCVGFHHQVSVPNNTLSPTGNHLNE